MKIHTNKLITETSPYLLQHAHNPVNWQGWNDEAWKEATENDKLVIISIGYSACHWCHVMEHESFENEEVASLMNKHFVNIKVDREERPDVDQIYMDAVQLITGRGGWPFNAIALPDGRPIYAGTYFPRENWIQILNYFAHYWPKNKKEALEKARHLTEGIRQLDEILPNSSPSIPSDFADNVFRSFHSVWDYQQGGRRGAPKFPMPVTVSYLLKHYYYTKNEQALKAAIITLDQMMDGGIYDQVGGGFARYSVDAEWEIPHFEKMLYDNAQLVSLYSQAYQLTKIEPYRDIVEETLAFCEREWSNSFGGFYSALDADSEGEEGKYYVWDYTELQILLGKDFSEFEQVFDMNPDGNFEGKVHLKRKARIVTDNNKVTEWKDLLLRERNKRIKPDLDDKTLTSWNGLLLKGYTDAYLALGNEQYLQKAEEIARFLKKHMISDDYSLKRTFKNGEAKVSGFLDDYSFTCEALIALYQSGSDEQWLYLAKNIADYAIQHFYNANQELFFYTSLTDSELIARKTETGDNVIPSSNSSMAKVMYLLGYYFEDHSYLQKAEKALKRLLPLVIKHPMFYANWASLALWFIHPPFEIVITGVESTLFKKKMNQHFLPNCIFSSAERESSLGIFLHRFKEKETLIYVCQQNTCKQPVNDIRDALRLIES